ncbi:MAG: transporter substrate-binding domain-containing protein [Bacteroidales bacterium]|nr:transporter substrate-binding domain-containing protein [Bacteroidales bacterium]MCF8389942.1 transporter substrate-binding domain-containing protein [Bacteroidales bacterium]
MNYIKVSRYIILMVFLFVPIIFSFDDTEDRLNNEIEEYVHDLSEIKMEGKLRVVTDFSSVNYYIYKGQPLGFQYEMLQELSDYLGIEIEVSVNNDIKQNFNALTSGNVDLIASNLTVTPERESFIDFTLPHSQSRQVLVQKANIQKLFHGNQELRDLKELSGKTVYVQKYSAHYQQLKNISENLGGTINIIEVPIETEQLIKMVSRGDIEYTVADEDIAMVTNSTISGLDIETVLGVPQEQAWAIRENTPELKNEINLWLESFTKTRKFAILQNKYFNSRSINKIVNSSYYYPESGRISQYDDIFKSEGLKIGWDWRMLASMVYQESRFNPAARSWAGAFGLMQLMPGTASRFGVSQNSPVRNQIEAGIKFIQWLDVRLIDLVPDPDERKKFILASYNIGFGHVKDAINLTEKYGGNPQLWEGNVEYYLLKKSEKEYNTDPVVVYGYARGTETSRYVKDIMYRYNHYLNIEESTHLAQVLQ